jgi:hypothetical protein
MNQMNISISQSNYKDQPAYTLESEQIQVLILPQCGAALASLIYKPLNKQILFQRPGDRYRTQPYDGVYTDGENAGIDDMFPTIDACSCLQPPWKGILLPDHGEVWSLPWNATIEEDGLTLSVHGVRLPYKLEKRIGFIAPDILRIDYSLTNYSPFPFDYLWAAHTMFNSEEGAEIVLPSGIKSVALTFSNKATPGKYGDQLDWPKTTLSNGNTRDLSQIRSISSNSVYKYYIQGPMPAGWCAARFHHSGYALGLSWTAERVPYLAVLPNEGGWDNTNSLYFEPSTCSFDRPDIGRYRGEVSTLNGFATHEWSLNLSLTTNLDFTHITSGGDFV